MPLACKARDCENPRVRGALLCAEHLGDKRKCEAPDCKKAARTGHTVCAEHGARGKRAAAISERSKALTTMGQFATPYSGTLDPLGVFEDEFRRTYGRILWLQDRIGDLKDEKDLIWGVTKEERIGASEFVGTNKTYEARIHVWEEMLRWERKHLLELTKVWVAAKLDTKRLEILREQVDYTKVLITRALTAFGHDITEPETRAILSRVFEDERQEEAR